MKPTQKNPQASLFGIQLERLCDLKHPLVQLAQRIQWEVFDQAFGTLYCQDNGRPAKSTRLMVGLHYLKAMYAESDEELVEKWIENPYWQYFCGEIEFQHEFPIEPTSMGKWRKRVQSAGLEKMLSETIATGLDTGILKREHFTRVNVDTTVQEKAIAFPTDGRLYHRMREKLVSEAKDLGVELRQAYTFKSKRALIMQGRYRHARQAKRANKELRKLKTYFGRVLRDLDRKTRATERTERLQELLDLGYQLFWQKREDKKKIYSLHAPEVECISKGKAHKKYEFGCKVSFVASSKGNFILGAQALHGNPYDGHTLPGAIEQAKRLIPEGSKTIAAAFVDQGYRGVPCAGIDVHVVKHGLKRIKPSLRKWMKRRSAIEPLIGHMKNDGGFKRNHLLGQEGDRINALLMACGYNLRKCLRHRAVSFLFLWWKVHSEVQIQLVRYFFALLLTEPVKAR